MKQLCIKTTITIKGINVSVENPGTVYLIENPGTVYLIESTVRVICFKFVYCPRKVSVPGKVLIFPAWFTSNKAAIKPGLFTICVIFYFYLIFFSFASGCTRFQIIIWQSSLGSFRFISAVVLVRITSCTAS